MRKPYQEMRLEESLAIFLWNERPKPNFVRQLDVYKKLRSNFKNMVERQILPGYIACYNCSQESKSGFQMSFYTMVVPVLQCLDTLGWRKVNIDRRLCGNAKIDWAVQIILCKIAWKSLSINVLFISGAIEYRSFSARQNALFGKRSIRPEYRLPIQELWP